MTRRGVVHTLDVFLAAVIIVTTLLFASQMPRERDYLEETGLDSLGMQALLMLESNGILGRLVDSGDWDGLELALRVVLPTRVSFNMTVIDEQGTVVNTREISNGGVSGRRIESVEYLLAVESSTCPIYRLRLQLGGP
ncbi:hypothetical protein H8E65_11030 [Candidatus Bathyarchaeota archaeon]|nr:hypothetical protein [Candidatus Bathyarchaeota archaeon]MBL7079085.1 hypothetical protein [Candidatus Bathyarchaeota archaeon]